MLLDNRVIKLVISLKFTRKQGFKLKKIERLIYIRNMNSFFNKEELIKQCYDSKTLELVKEKNLILG